MDLEELIQSIHTLESYMQKLEEKYRLRSEDFYRLVTEGKLDQSADFIEWLGLYEIKLKREHKYHQLLAQILTTAMTRHEDKETVHLPIPSVP